MDSIREESGIYEIRIAGSEVRGSSTYAAKFLNSVPKEKHACAKEYKDLPCGKCYASVTESWGIEYRWWDSTIDGELLGRFESGQLDQRGYELATENARLQCHIDGYSKIGYSYKPVN